MKIRLFILLVSAQLYVQAVHPIKMQITQKIKPIKKKTAKKPSKTKPQPTFNFNISRPMPAQ